MTSASAVAAADVFERWTQRERYDDSRERWLAALPDLMRALDGSTVGAEFLRRFVRAQCAWLDKRIRARLKLPSKGATRALVESSSAIVGVIVAAELAGDREAQQGVVEVLIHPAYPVSAAIAVLRETRHDSAPLRGLRAACVERLEQLAREPPRAKDDWSIKTDLKCTCEHCKRLARFLIR